MRTILNGQQEVFRTIAAGVAKHDGVQLVLSIAINSSRSKSGRVLVHRLISRRLEIHSELPG
jgi:hypothetical protein